MHDSTNNDIAIIGMECRVPGAKNLAQFWGNIVQKVDCKTKIDVDSMRRAGVSEKQIKDPNYVPYGYIVEDTDKFDAEFFGYSPGDAKLIDPQQRLFLECCSSALESAGYAPEKNVEKIGVYAGVFSSSYLMNIWSNPDLTDSVGEMAIRHGNEKDYIATRVAYKLNLTGPALSIQTSCSTSLVAVHVACQSLLAGECDIALAGGVSIVAEQNVGYLYRSGGLTSSSGECRPFDKSADGTVFGNGLGVVVLKRLVEAVADGDYVYAVIKGTAINNDGAGKVGFTAPSSEGQAAVISEAIAVAGFPPNSIGLLEAHGTGTPLGDPIEIDALCRAWGSYTDSKSYCAIGSVKSNVGHLGTAAGVVGLIKVALSLHNRTLPATIHYSEPNENIDFESTPFYVNVETKPWPTPETGARRAAVSSFGMGGTNAHAILEEAPATISTAENDDPHVFAISARTEHALMESVRNLREFLSANVQCSFSDVAHSLRVGRHDFRFRSTLVVSSKSKLADPLPDLSGMIPTAALERPKVLFMFSGQGAQHWDMARGLYREFQVFRQEFDRCNDLLVSHSGVDLRRLVDCSDADAAWLNSTAIAQPAVFVTQICFAALLASKGVRPHALIGHSLGEYAAATLAGVMSVEDALVLVAARGKLMQSLPAGAMLAVQASFEHIEHVRSKYPDVSLAAENTPRHFVVAASKARLEELLTTGVFDRNTSRFLPADRAFHSRAMHPILPEFRSALSAIQFKDPAIPLVSNVTGTWIEEGQARDPSYWASHALATVQFSKGIDAILTEPNTILVDLGPSNTLSSLVRNAWTKSECRVVSIARHSVDKSSDQLVFARALAQLWEHGVDVDLSDGAGRRVPLPTYPFARERHWIERRGSVDLPAESSREVASTDESQDTTDAPPETQQPDMNGASNAEIQVKNIWRQLFGVDTVTGEENFFDAGGSSLTAIQLISRIREVLGIEINIEDLFDDPTLNGVIGQVTRQTAGGEAGSVRLEEGEANEMNVA